KRLCVAQIHIQPHVFFRRLTEFNQWLAENFARQDRKRRQLHEQGRDADQTQQQPGQNLLRPDEFQCGPDVFARGPED
ncbi:hypothetical protein ABTM70_19205, partial [Acinetobacter baumannii]